MGQKYVEKSISIDLTKLNKRQADALEQVIFEWYIPHEVKEVVKVKQSIKVVSASWCPTCGPYKKALEQAGIEFESVDADDVSNMEFIQKHGVRGLPTTIVYEGDVYIGTVVGNNVAKLKELINE